MRSLGNAIFEECKLTDEEIDLLMEVDKETSFHDISASEEDWRKFLQKLSEKGFEDLQKIRDKISDISNHLNRKVIIDDREATGTVHVNEEDNGDYVQVDEFDKLSQAKRQYPHAEVLE